MVSKIARMVERGAFFIRSQNINEGSFMKIKYYIGLFDLTGYIAVILNS